MKTCVLCPYFYFIIRWIKTFYDDDVDDNVNGDDKKMSR